MALIMRKKGRNRTKCAASYLVCSGTGPYVLPPIWCVQEQDHMCCLLFGVFRNGTKCAASYLACSGTELNVPPRTWRVQERN